MTQEVHNNRPEAFTNNRASLAQAVKWISKKIRQRRRKALLNREAKRLGIKLPSDRNIKSPNAPQPRASSQNLEAPQLPVNRHYKQLKKAAETREHKLKRSQTASDKRQSSPDTSRIRIPRYSSFYFYQQSLKIWNLLLASLTLDFLVVYFFSPMLTSLRNTHRYESFLYLLLILTLLSSARDSVISIFHHFWVFLERLVAYTKKHRVLVLAAVVIFVSLEIGIKLVNGKNFVLVIAGLIFGLSAFLSLWHDFKEGSKLQDKLAQDRIFWVEHLNHQYFALAIAPLVFNRALSVVALILALHGAQPVLSYTPWGIVTLVLMLVLKPKQEYFMSNCRGCSSKTSRALENLGYCPRCAPQEFESKDTPQ